MATGAASASIEAALCLLQHDMLLAHVCDVFSGGYCDCALACDCGGRGVYGHSYKSVNKIICITLPLIFHALRHSDMERLDELLSHFFQVVQVFDPTNYIGNDEELAAPAAPQHAVAQQSAVDAAAVAIAAPDTATNAAAQDTDERRCPVCLEVATGEWIVFGPCSHGVCAECARALVHHAAHARRAPVRCATCGAALDGAATLGMADGEDVQRLGDALAVAAAGRVRYCCECGEAMALDDFQGGDFSCVRCNARTCVQCGASAHESRCDDVIDGESTALAHLVASRGWTRCAGCGALASKHSTGSCNYALCLCGTPICLRCGKQYRSTTADAPAAPAASAANMHGVPSCDCGLFEM